MNTIHFKVLHGFVCEAKIPANPMNKAFNEFVTDVSDELESNSSSNMIYKTPMALNP